MFIKSVDSDYMTLLYTYLAIYVIYNCAKKILRCCENHFKKMKMIKSENLYIILTCYIYKVKTET